MNEIEINRCCPSTISIFSESLLCKIMDRFGVSISIDTSLYHKKIANMSALHFIWALVWDVEVPDLQNIWYY